MSNTLTRALISHFDSVFYGPNRDYASVLESVEKLSVNRALWKPEPNHNSIWQIVEHLIASKDWEVAMITRQELPSLRWFSPSGDEAAWQNSLVRLREAHMRLKQTLEKLSDEELLDIRDAKSGQTLLQLILSSGPAHDAHHSGQLDYLRGMQAGKNTVQK